MAQPKEQVRAEDLMRNDFPAWLEANSTISTQELRMKYGLKPPFHSWISQLEAHRKYFSKFENLFQIQWAFPTGVALEQSSSVATALWKASLIQSPYTIDLCAGMGVDSWALSQRDEAVLHWANELNPGLADLLKHNLKESKITCEDASNLNLQITTWKLEHNITNASLALYVDPDRRAGGQKDHSLEKTVPHLPSMQKLWLDLADVVLSKHSPMADLKELSELDHCAAIYVVEYQGECKELLCLQKAGHHGPPAVWTVQIMNGNRAEVLLKDDSAAHYSSSSEISTYLIQPGPALAKSQAHGQLAKEGGWKKLAAGNLYTSEICPTSSPFYKRYEVLEVAKPYKLKNAVDAGSIERIGFPEHPDQIRKKLGWKEGRAVKLFALKIGSTKSMVLTKYLD